MSSFLGRPKPTRQVKACLRVFNINMNLTYFSFVINKLEGLNYNEGFVN